MKNPAGKQRRLTSGDAPYMVWTDGGFTYFVTKTYQAPDPEAANPYARWMVGCISPMERGDGWRYGRDAYVADIKRGSRLVWIDAAYRNALQDAGLHLSAAYSQADSTPDGWKGWTK